MLFPMARDDAERRVWTFDESDYLFGAGALRMIVESVDWSRPRVRDGGPGARGPALGARTGA